MRVQNDPNLPMLPPNASEADKSLNMRLIAMFRSIAQQLNMLSEGSITARHAAQTTYPTTGTWQQGDIVWNSSPASTGYIGWVCTAAGTPGTWKGFGVIA